MWRKPFRAVMDRVSDKYITQPLQNSPTFVKSVQSVHKAYVDLQRGKFDLGRLQKDLKDVKNSPEFKDEFRNIQNMQQELHKKTQGFKQQSENMKPTFFEWLSGAKPEGSGDPVTSHQKKKFIDSSFSRKKK